MRIQKVGGRRGGEEAEVAEDWPGRRGSRNNRYTGFDNDNADSARTGKKEDEEPCVPQTVSRWSAGTEEGHSDRACLPPRRYRSVFTRPRRQSETTSLRVRTCRENPLANSSKRISEVCLSLGRASILRDTCQYTGRTFDWLTVLHCERNERKIIGRKSKLRYTKRQADRTVYR